MAPFGAAIKTTAPMSATTRNKKFVTLGENEIREFLARYPGLERLDVLGAVVRAGPSRTAIDAEIAKLWGKLVLSTSRYIN